MYILDCEQGHFIVTALIFIDTYITREGEDSQALELIDKVIIKEAYGIRGLEFICMILSDFIIGLERESMVKNAVVKVQ